MKYINYSVNAISEQYSTDNPHGFTKNGFIQDLMMFVPEICQAERMEFNLLDYMISKYLGDSTDEDAIRLLLLPSAASCLSIIKKLDHF